MGKAHILIDTNQVSTKQEPLLSAFYKMSTALEDAFRSAQTDLQRWAIVNHVRIFVNQMPYEKDDVSYQEMREYLRELPERLGF